MSDRFDALAFFEAGMAALFEQPPPMKAEPEPAAPVCWPPAPRSRTMLQRMRVMFACMAYEAGVLTLKHAGQDVQPMTLTLQAWAMQAADRAMAAGRAHAGKGEPTGMLRWKHEGRLMVLRRCLDQGERDPQQLAQRIGVSRATFYRNWWPMVRPPGR